MNNDTLFKKKLSLLMTLGSEYSLPSLEKEQYLYRFDQDLQIRLGHNFWTEKWENEFPTDREKIILLKGVILLEKIYEKNGARGLMRGSATVTTLVFKQVEEKKLLNPRLFAWILLNRSSNLYTPFGGMKYSHIKNYAEYLAFIESEKSRESRTRETERIHSLNRERKEVEKLKKAEDYKIRIELTKDRNKFKNKLVKDYFAKNDNKFLDDIISKKLPFPLNLTPIEEVNAVISKTTQLSNRELEMLIASIPRKSASHIKAFKQLLVEQLDSRPR